MGSSNFKILHDHHGNAVLKGAFGQQEKTWKMEVYREGKSCSSILNSG
ncbi:Protein of unknown function [Pyronema omphalodes CBS 100304]|uniref:Uncharacterized protein n=1 Tax=Pyronema omphalodes (strain CBS 100304) TaxID=1076935 RepID=U4L5V6_PYROM|nr:Protein of unknown function [Pyronema omphalodes CBS 100304]